MIVNVICTDSSKGKHTLHLCFFRRCERKLFYGPVFVIADTNRYFRFFDLKDLVLKSFGRNRHWIFAKLERHIYWWCPMLLVNFRNKSIFLRWAVVSPTPNPQTGGPPIVDCLRLLIQYIRNYPLYLEAVSSIRNLRTRHAVVTRYLVNTAMNLGVP
jgi:hypothetical protein